MTPVISKIEFNNIPDSNNNIIVVDFKDIQPLLHKDSVNVTDIIKRMEKRSIDEVRKWQQMNPQKTILKPF